MQQNSLCSRRGPIRNEALHPYRRSVDPRGEFIRTTRWQPFPPSTVERTYVPTTDLTLKTGN